MCKYQIEGKKVNGTIIEDFGPITRETHDPNHSQYYDPEDGNTVFTELIFDILELY